MKKLMATVLALSIVAMSSMAFAQPEQFDAGIFGDDAGTMTSMAAVDFVPFNVYVVGFDLDGQVKAMEWSVDFPANLTILGLTLAGPAPGNIGDNLNVIAFTGACVDAAGPFVLGAYNVGFFAPGAAQPDVALCLGASTPSSFNPAAPGYSQCDNTLVPFGVALNGEASGYPNGCFILNPTMDPPVATEFNSFGEIKARF